jgi:hypothetical protein
VDQPELGKDDEPGATRASLADQRVVTLEVLVEPTEGRRDLGERDSQGGHGPSLAGSGLREISAGSRRK